MITAKKHSKKTVQTTASTRSVFQELFNPEEAAELEIKSGLLRGVQKWLADSGLTQVQAAEILKVSQARISDMKQGKVSQFSLGLLVRLAARAGLHPRLMFKKSA